MRGEADNYNEANTRLRVYFGHIPGHGGMIHCKVKVEIGLVRHHVGPRSGTEWIKALPVRVFHPFSITRLLGE